MIVEASEKFEITSIVISHDMRSTFRIADQVIMIKDGGLSARRLNWRSVVIRVFCIYWMGT